MTKKKKSTERTGNRGVKASLAWKLSDYLDANEEPPECVIQGRTEGEIMEKEEVFDWISDSLRCLRVIIEEYPEQGERQKQIFRSDLEYLRSLGKITEDEYEKLNTEDTFTFYE